MIERHFYADPDTPFHVWVREQCGAQGYRWVLRDVRTASSYIRERNVPTPFLPAAH